MNEETQRNALQNLRSILSDYASEEFARELGRGPINGLVDSNELYNIFWDFFEMFVPQPGAEWSSTLPDEIERALTTFQATLDDVMLNKPDYLSDATLVASPAWGKVQSEAAALLHTLRDL